MFYHVRTFFKVTFFKSHCMHFVRRWVELSISLRRYCDSRTTFYSRDNRLVAKITSTRKQINKCTLFALAPQKLDWGNIKITELLDVNNNTNSISPHRNGRLRETRSVHVPELERDMFRSHFGYGRLPSIYLCWQNIYVPRVWRTRPVNKK